MQRTTETAIRGRLREHRVKRLCFLALLIAGNGAAIAHAQTATPAASYGPPQFSADRSAAMVGPRYALQMTRPQFAAMQPSPTFPTNMPTPLPPVGSEAPAETPMPLLPTYYPAPPQTATPIPTYTAPAPYNGVVPASSPGSGLPTVSQPPTIIRTAAESTIIAPPLVTLAADTLPVEPTENIPAGITVGVFRIHDLVGLAIANNPILRKAEAEIEAVMGERVQAGLYPNPNMETNNPEVFAGQNSFVNFGWAQTIIVKGKMRLDKAAADQLVRSETAEYRLERSRMITEVRKQYYETLAAKHRVHLARHLTGIAERGLNGARQLEKAGEGTRTDVLLLDTAYQREQIILQNAETTYQGELKQLAAIVGMPELEIRDVDGTLFDVPPQFNEQDVLAFLTRAGSYIERARADITRSQVELRRQEVEPYPNIRLGPSFNTGTLAHTAQFWLTVEFLIPVWDLNQGNIRKAHATVEEQLAELEIVRNELNRKTAELFAKYRTSRDLAERIRVQILPNAQQAQSLIQDAYVKGEFDVNRLLEAQRNLAEVSSDYFEAAEESWVTAAELAGMLQIEQFP